MSEDEAWRVAVAQARLHAKQNDAASAASFAQQALRLLADNGLKVARRPEVSLIETDLRTVKEMQKLAGGSGS
jgi:hypothetical protein